MIRWISLVLLFVGLSSCVTMSKEACQSMDWATKGREDAYQGTTPNNFAGYIKMCSKHGIQPNRKAYSMGYEKGLESFCTEMRGRSFGKSGGQYTGQCPKSKEKAFLRAYQEGYREFQLDQREAELRERERALEDRERALPIFGKKCSFDSDCTIEDECSFSRCERSGRSCTFDSDCEVEGDCNNDRCEY